RGGQGPLCPGGGCEGYAPPVSGQRWKGRRDDARVVLTTDRDVFVCFLPVEAELLPLRDLPLHRPLQLGPDLLSPEPDLAEVARRALADPSRPVAEVLLDQRVAAGLGNAYKSELCFLGPYPGDLREGDFWRPNRGVQPWEAVGTLGFEGAASLFARGRDALRANLGGWPRTTTWDRRREPDRRGPTHWVYARAGKPCLRCGQAIQSRLWGADARVTCWCPACQPSL
ncbi:MAG: hypothetical protein AB1758_17225, partial [Candidatus Eremiobacterota bacterium]